LVISACDGDSDARRQLELPITCDNRLGDCLANTIGDLGDLALSLSLSLSLSL